MRGLLWLLNGRWDEDEDIQIVLDILRTWEDVWEIGNKYADLLRYWPEGTSSSDRIKLVESADRTSGPNQSADLLKKRTIRHIGDLFIMMEYFSLKMHEIS